MPPGDTSPFPTLSTDRLTLRALTPGDATAFRAVLCAPGVTQFSNWPDAPTQEQGETFATDMAALFPGGHGCAWAILERASGRFIGAIRYNYFQPAWKCGGIGYEMHPDAWGQGYMTEVVRAVVGCGHGVFGLNRIEAWTLHGNGASDRVLEKAGFRLEGVQRQKAWFKDTFHDFRMFGRVAGDPMG